MPLRGPSGSNSNLDGDHRFKPLSSGSIASWMHSIVCEVMKKWDSVHKVSPTSRGARIEGMGHPKRNYDVIPAFMYKDENGDHHHVIPNGTEWEANPTMKDMRIVMDLDREFARDPSNKILGYRDLVRAVKYISAKHDWANSHNVSSFVIRFVVAEVLLQTRSKFNHKQINAIIEQLNQLIGKGHFLDPYVHDRIVFSSKVPLRWAVEDLS
eukprot:ANDGO_01836.mRNA.1 hypothetical protein